MATGEQTKVLAGTKLLRSTIWVPAPLTVVWPFFCDAANLPLMTPPWLRFLITTPSPIVMREGARIDYRLRVRGLPMRWRTRIARWEPPNFFSDEQEKGPYRLWRHTHSFAGVDGGTQIGDHVEFLVRGGFLAPLISRWFVEGDVQRIFRYRLQRIVERFGGDAATGRIWIEPVG
jgi:ligand-binding SRPBCC domain-containing protein